MKRSLKSFVTVLAICLILLAAALPFAGPVSAATSNVFDYSGTLSGSDLYDADTYLATTSQQLQFDIVVLIIDEGYDSDKLMATAEDFYDYNGFGYKSTHDGVILAVDMDSSNMLLVSTGYGIEAITEYGEEVIYDYIMDDMSDGKFKNAFTKFADVVYDFVKLARNNDPVDWDTPGYPSYPWYEGTAPNPGNSGMDPAEAAAASGAGAIAVGAAAGAISSGRKKSRLKTVRTKTQANSYERQGSLVLSDRRERFLYSNVVATPRAQQGGGGGGMVDRGHGTGPRTSGTIVHTGHSGTMHGGGAGGGRKF